MSIEKKEKLHIYISAHMESVKIYYLFYKYLFSFYYVLDWIKHNGG